jgi:hypothetical protein
LYFLLARLLINAHLAQVKDHFKDGQPLTEDTAKYGRVYRLGSTADLTGFRLTKQVELRPRSPPLGLNVGVS